MSVSLADIAEIDAATYELPKDYTPRDVEILHWLFIRARGDAKDLREAKFTIKTLKAEIEKLKRKKTVVTELAKPLNKSVKFDDLTHKLLQIYLAEETIHSVKIDIHGNPILTGDAAKVQEAVQHAAELIILLTTYIDRYKVDEDARRELFKQLEDGKWFL